MQTATARAGSIVAAMDTMTNQLRAVAQEQNVSEVLLLTMLKDYATRRLETVINLEQEIYGRQ